MQVPKVCEYQTALLTLELTDEDGVMLLVVTQAYSGDPPFLSVKFDELLKPDANYILEIIVSAVTQNVTLVSIVLLLESCS